MEYLELAKTYLECNEPKLSLKCLSYAKEFQLSALLCERLGKVQCGPRLLLGKRLSVSRKGVGAVSASLASGRGSIPPKRERLVLSTLGRYFFLRLHRCSGDSKDTHMCACSCPWECLRPNINHREAICSNQREDWL